MCKCVNLISATSCVSAASLSESAGEEAAVCGQWSQRRRGRGPLWPLTHAWGTHRGMVSTIIGGHKFGS